MIPVMYSVNNWLALFHNRTPWTYYWFYQSSGRFEGDKKEEARKSYHQQDLKNEFHQTAELDPLIPQTLPSQLDLQISQSFPQLLFLLKGN